MCHEWGLAWMNLNGSKTNGWIIKTLRVIKYTCMTKDQGLMKAWIKEPMSEDWWSWQPHMGSSNEHESKLKILKAP